jgi:hypothetical protein
MIDARTQSLLQDIVRRTGRSMLQYVGEAYPWASEEGQPLLTKLHDIVDDEEKTTEELARFLRRRRVPLPYLGAYPETFSNINYVSLDYLLPKLLDYQHKAIASLERDLGQVHDTEIKTKLENLLGVNRKHLEALEKLASTNTKAGAH